MRAERRLRFLWPAAERVQQFLVLGDGRARLVREPLFVHPEQDEQLRGVPAVHVTQPRVA